MGNENPREEGVLETFEHVPRLQGKPMQQIAVTIENMSARLRTLGISSAETSTRSEHGADNAGFYIVSRYTIGDSADEQKLRATIATANREGRECQITREGNTLKLWVR